jgi:hypothetical protein
MGMEGDNGYQADSSIGRNPLPLPLPGFPIRPRTFLTPGTQVAEES